MSENTMTEKKPEKVEEKKERFELVEVPTETGVFVRDNEKEVILDDKTVMLNILRTVEEIKKSVA